MWQLRGFTASLGHLVAEFKSLVTRATLRACPEEMRPAIEALTLRRLIVYWLKAAIVFLPFVGALFLIRGYDGRTSVWVSVIGSFNRIEGNGYPLGSAVLLLLVAGYFSTLLNMMFYFVGV